MTPADKLLPRLAGLRQASPGKWNARCPAHDDKSPSLSIKEGEDGRLLLHCWGGCKTQDVVAAVGLDMRDLFITDPSRPRRVGPSPKAIHFELRICRIAEAQLAQGMPLSPADQARYELARQRLGVV